MTTNSIHSNPIYPSFNQTPDTFKSRIDAFIHELDTTIKSDKWNQFSDLSYQHCQELLTECMELAGTDTSRISQIKAAVDEYNQQAFDNKNLLKFLIETRQFSLADQL